MAKNIYILGKVRDLLDYMAMHTLYFFLYLSYCVEIWGDTYVNTIKPPYLLQKKVTQRIHIHVKSRGQTNNLFIKFKLLKDLVKLQTK